MWFCRMLYVYIIFVMVSIKADVWIHCFQLGQEDYACYASRALFVRIKIISLLLLLLLLRAPTCRDLFGLVYTAYLYIYINTMLYITYVIRAFVLINAIIRDIIIIHNIKCIRRAGLIPWARRDVHIIIGKTNNNYCNNKI